MVNAVRLAPPSGNVSEATVLWPGAAPAFATMYESCNGAPRIPATLDGPMTLISGAGESTVMLAGNETLEFASLAMAWKL